jgi:uncharacterized delta-60 repeat protein
VRQETFEPIALQVSRSAMTGKFRRAATHAAVECKRPAQPAKVKERIEMRRITISLTFVFVIAIALSCALWGTKASADNGSSNSALDGFDPNANGLVRVAVVQPDGKILIGGDFTTLAPNGRLPVTRNYIARLNTDGTVDPTFNPSANSSVQAIALQPDGKIILGGDFNGFAPNGGASIIRGNLARFNADGTLDTTFDPRANGSVRALGVQTDGAIVVGGEFQQFNFGGGGVPVTRNRVARLNPNGTLDPIFNPNANSPVDTLALQPDGRIIIGGRFTKLEFRGATIDRKYIARLNVDGTVDESFDPNADNDVASVAVQPDGKVLLGGTFNNLAPNDGSPILRNHLARVNVNGTLDTTFTTAPNGIVRTIVVQPDGRILLGGGFISIAPNGGTSVLRKYIARLNPDGTLDPGVNPVPNDQVFAIAVQSDGKIIVGGVFNFGNSFAGQPRNRIARLETDGRLDQSLNLNAVGGGVGAIALQPDGKILIGGAFTNILGVARNNIARLNTDGTIDTTFDPNVIGSVSAIAVQADGRIVVGGFFVGFAPNGGPTIARNRVARLNIDGTVDLTFNPNANDGIYAIALQPDGKILLGGYFSMLAPNGGPSVPRGFLARLEVDGTVDTNFRPDPNSPVFAIAVQTDAKILIGGAFTSLSPPGGSTVTRQFVARVNNNGTIDMAFDPNADNPVTAFAIQPDGKILVGGQFSTFAPNGGATIERYFLARLNSDGTVDNSFNTRTNQVVETIALQADGKILIGGMFHAVYPNGGAAQERKFVARINADGTVDTFDPQATDTVMAIALQSDGKILTGGMFDSIGGQSRNLFARLANDSAAIQNLAVTQTSVTWTRSGAGPELWRVSFERSTDGLNYTFLGNGTRAGTSSNFTLTGQNLTAQQNLYVRARGFYRGGQFGTSESITQSVRNVFLPQALHLAFAQQPTNAPENGTITPAVTVRILDAANTLVNSTAAVTVGIGANPSSGTLAGTKTVAAVGGTATFNNLAIDKLGIGYTLSASGTNLTGAASNSFNITVNAPSNISATSGSGQSAPINTTFDRLLQAKVTDVNNNPVSGVVVTFNAPANGASGTFENNTTTTTATTDQNGLAISASLTANGTEGLYSVSASINGGSPSTAFSLTNAKANQTIIVTTHAPAGATFNTQFSVAATSSSGLPVSYKSSGACTNNGATFTMNSGTGTCTVNYTQAGDANHNPAQLINETVTAKKAAQAITFDAIADKVFGDSDFAVNATSNSGLGVNFAASGNCTNSGSTVHITGAGTCTITVSQPDNSSYDAAPDLARSFNIAKAGSTTIVTASDAIYDGGAHGGSATVTGPGGLSQNLTVSYSGRNGTVFSSSTAPTNAGDYTASATYEGDANHNGSSDSKNFTIARASQTIEFNALSNKTFGDADFAVNASSSSGLAVDFAASGQCAISGLNVHITGAGGCTITASQSGDTNYSAATDVLRSFQIMDKATQTITFDSLPDKTFGDADFVVSASSSSGLPVSFATSGQCSNAGSLVHLDGAGGCTVTASQGGDSNHNAAPEVSRSFQIGKASTTTQLSFAVDSDQGAIFTATVASAAGIPNGTVTFKNDGVIIAAGSDVALNSGQASCAVPALPAGTHTFTAEYSGEANFNASNGTFLGGAGGTAFEFSQATYVVTERGGSVAIKVKRSGDVSAGSSVDYLTDDGSVSSAAVPCSLVTGFALERCDYTRASGTLQFAANETEKSFVVLVNDDSYTESTEITSLKLSNPGAGATLGAQAAATLQITDDVSESLDNPVDDGANFVRQHYHDFLNREPDSGGFNFWSGGLAQCDADACGERKRVDTSAAFFFSIEFQETGYLVQRFYKAAFGDANGASNLGGPHQIAVPIIRLREFLHDTQEIEQGVIVNQAGWQEQLENRKQVFAREFASREGFRNAFPDSLNAKQFVAQLDANAGRVLTDAEIAQLEGVFGGPDASSADAVKRAQVMRSVAENRDLQQREFNRAFVLMQYFGYLRRNPGDFPDTDYTGFDFWLSKLNQFGGNYINAEMVKAFISANEYRQRFGQ